MFSIFDRATRLCDGISRREMLRIGGLSTFGLSLPSLLRASTEGPPPGIIEDPTFGCAKNIVFVWLQGGPPQHETFDPKPKAASEIRGPFKPIQTNVPGIEFCELLPRTARIADKLAVIRSMATDNNQHSGSAYEVLTGYKYQGPNPRTITPDDWPYFGSIVKMLRPSDKLPPLTTVWLPQVMRLNENVTPAGQTAGFLGGQWDPDLFTGDPSDPNYEVEGLRLNDVPPMQLRRRMSLLEQIEKHFRQVERGRLVGIYDQFQAQAFDLLTSDRVKKAFAIQKEPPTVRNRYGRTRWGQCLLLARRLVEVGVRMVHVNWTREPGDSAVDNPMWDTHAQNADRLEDVLCPMFDVGFTALIDDLDQRGLLDETLVVAIGEFGRTPKINAAGGRDHWGPVFSFLMSGAGITTAQVYGASDKDGGHPARDRVTPADLTATIFHLLGIRHESTFHDAERREHRVTTGSPIRSLLGGGDATTERTPAGGSLDRLPAYTDNLLLNTDFSNDAPLYPTDRGSRPKGWRATPIVELGQGGGFGVAVVRNTKVSGSRLGAQALIGLLDGQATTAVNKGTQAILAQEMRNPRAGTFRFRVKARGEAASKETYERAFLKNFRARIVIYRYTQMTKDPTQREELSSAEIRPPFYAETDSAKSAEFELTKRLDSAKPGQNFSIGKGLGVAIIVEKTTDGSVELPDREAGAFIRVDRAELEFDSRTINNDVTV